MDADEGEVCDGNHLEELWGYDAEASLIELNWHVAAGGWGYDDEWYLMHSYIIQLHKSKGK